MVIKHTPLGISVDETPLSANDYSVSAEGMFPVEKLKLEGLATMADFTITSGEDNFFGMHVEKPARITTNSFNEYKLVKEAQEFLHDEATFLFALGRVDNVNLVDIKPEEVENDKIKTGVIKFAIRLVNDSVGRTISLEIPIPIIEGTFEKPTHFKTGSKKYIFSDHGVKQAFNVDLREHYSPKFPDFRASRRWPMVIKRYVEELR